MPKKSSAATGAKGHGNTRTPVDSAMVIDNSGTDAGTGAGGKGAGSGGKGMRSAKPGKGEGHGKVSEQRDQHRG